METITVLHRDYRVYIEDIGLGIDCLGFRV